MSNERAKPVPYFEAERIANNPLVDEALRALVADSCADNGVFVVQAVMAAVIGIDKGYCIRHVDGRWRTLDTMGMPDWTHNPEHALCFRRVEHAHAFAEDDPDDVRIVRGEREWPADAQVVLIADELRRGKLVTVQDKTGPRVVREGRDFDVKFHDNGAAPNAGRAHVNLWTSGSATEDAAPPSAAQPVAWTMSELCRFFAYAYRAGHEDTCEAVYTHVLECDADTYHQDSVVEYLTDNGMNAAPPDLAARVCELEALLRCVHPGANGPECCDIEGTNWFDARDAALAKGE